MRNEFQIIDYLAEARARYTEQFKYASAPIFDSYVQVLLKGKLELQEVFRQLMQERSLDTATGVNLDNIGEIVGQDRELLSVDVLDYFGFSGQVNAGSFGKLADPTVGAMFYSLNSPDAGNVLLTDDIYRLFIKAKIFKNSMSATPEEFISAVMLIFGVDKVQITEGRAHITVLIGKSLSPMERALLNYVSYSSGYPSRLVPRPLGVSLEFGQFDGQNFFGFVGVQGAKGFGSLNRLAGGYGFNYGQSYGQVKYETTPGSGGKFAKLF